MNQGLRSIQQRKQQRARARDWSQETRGGGRGQSWGWSSSKSGTCSLGVGGLEQRTSLARWAGTGLVGEAGLQVCLASC